LPALVLYVADEDLARRGTGFEAHSGSVGVDATI